MASRVVIAGGGVAALEGALALREFAGPRVEITLVAPNPTFSFRALSTIAPFDGGPRPGAALAEIADEINARHVAERVSWLDHRRSQLHTQAGQTLDYDALLIAIGARSGPAFRSAVTLDDARLPAQWGELETAMQHGDVRSVAFVAPSVIGWPLPLYELALLCRRRADQLGVDVSVTLATPEDAPLALFGDTVSQAVGLRLQERGILVLTGARSAVPEPGVLAVHPRARRLRVDRILALPHLSGPPLRGLGARALGGFIAVDAFGRVKGVPGVFAAGDAIDFTVKHGGLAAAQAETAARVIAAAAGAAVVPRRFAPEIRAVLADGQRSLYLSARITGAHGSRSQVGDEPSWWPATKVAAPRLAARMRAVANATSGPSEPDSSVVAPERPSGRD